MNDIILNEIEKLITSIVIILILIGFYFFILFILKRIIQRNDRVILDHINTSVTIILRIFTGIVIINIITIIYELPGEIIVYLSLLTGAIIALSSLQLLNNVISGIFISILNPFKVNDFISIGPYEGKVISINLNVTNLLTIDDTFVVVQNRNVFRSEFTNFTIYNKKTTEKNKRIFDLLEKNSFIKLKKYVQYSFQMSVPLLAYSHTREKLDLVCETFMNNFKFKPYFYPVSAGFKFDIQFIVLTPNSNLLLKHLKNFREALLKEIY